MTFIPEIHVGDIGTALRFTVKDQDTGLVADLSLADVLKIYFLKPNGTSTSKTAEFYTNGTDGIVHWDNFDSADWTHWSVAGEWEAQVYIELPGWRGYTNRVTFRVFAPIA